MNDNPYTAQRDLNRQRFLMWSLAFYLGFLFLVVLIRAAVTGITYDEAYTYIHFGRMDLLDFRGVGRLFLRKDCIANNHWLNSVLINITVHATGMEYSEFMIRLPSLFFLVLYLVGVVWGYRRKYYSLMALFFLISNYYLLEFYGLARGYGMANTLVFFACCSYCEWKKSDYLKHQYLNRLMVLMSLAVFANTIVLLLYPAFGLVCFYRLIQRKQIAQFFRKNWFLMALFLLFTFLMIFYHMNISAEEKPLYTGGERGFFDCLVCGYVRMFFDDQIVEKGFSIVIAAGIVSSLAILNKRLRDNDYSLMLVIFVITNLAAQLILRKGYITGRVLLPFYSFLVFCMRELYLRAWKKCFIGKTWRRTGSVFANVVCAALVILCVTRTNIHKTQEWRDNYPLRNQVEGAIFAGEEYSSGKQYYWTEEFYLRKYGQIKMDYLNGNEEKSENK